MTEIISKHFSMDTIKQVSGVKLLTQQEKQMIQMQSQPSPANPQPQPIPEETQELMELPTWEDVEKLIRDDVALCFRIDIETDSTIKVDQEAEKASRIELLTAAGGFIQQAAMVQDPDIQTLLMEMLMFGVRGFKVGRELETTFKTTMDKMRKRSEQPQQPPPDPAAMAAQAQAQNDAERLKLETAQAQADAQHQSQELQVKAQLEQQKMSNEAEKAQAEVQIRHAELQIKQAELQIKRADLALREQELHSNHTLKLQEMQNSHDLEHKKIESSEKTALMQKDKPEEKKDDKGLNEGLKAIGAGLEAISRPKTTTITRGKDGKATGAVQE